MKRFRILLVYIFICSILFFAGCSTTGSTALSKLSGQQALSAVLAEQIAVESSGLATDLKDLEPVAGPLLPAIIKVRKKAEGLESQAKVLNASLSAEREITVKAQTAIGKTEISLAKAKTQRNIFGFIIVVIILLVAGFTAFRLILRV